MALGSGNAAGPILRYVITRLGDKTMTDRPLSEIAALGRSKQLPPGEQLIYDQVRAYNRETVAAGEVLQYRERIASGDLDKDTEAEWDKIVGLGEAGKLGKAEQHIYNASPNDGDGPGGAEAVMDHRREELVIKGLL